MSHILRLLYVVLSYLLVPLLLLHLAYKGLGNRDYWRRVGERFGFFPGIGYRDVIWVHAVSVGEVQAAAPLIRALLDSRPDKPVVVTTMTPTGSDRVRSLFGGTVVHCYAPFDLDWAVKRFFNWCRPQIAIILETELWPNLYHECGTRDVPLVLASARVSAKSASRYRYLVSLFEKTLSHGIVIAAQTPIDAERFVSIGANPERACVTGNIKFDFTLPAGVEAEGAALRAAHAGERPVWIAGSTHAGEEEQVLAAHRKVQKEFPAALLILVPRHPERFDGVAALVEKEGFALVRRSSGATSAADTDVLLVDTMGELMKFYAASDVAFVGGSLVKIGGHNLLEPAALHLPIVTGPYTYNAPDIAELLQTGGEVTVANDPATLADEVLLLFNDPEHGRQRGAKGAALIEQNRGALGRLLELLQPLIK